MIILMDVLNVLGVFLGIIGLLFLIILLIKKIKKQKITYLRIFVSLFVPLTGIILVWLVFINPVHITKNSEIKVSNQGYKPINVRIVDTKKINYSYEKKYVNVIQKSNSPSFLIKSTELNRNSKTKIIVNQSYYNNFLVNILKKDIIYIKKV